MHLCQTIENPSEISNCWLYFAAESYLYVGQRIFSVVRQVEKNHLLLDEVTPETKLWVTVCKIISYAIFILPLLALAIKAFYRKDYTFHLIPASQQTILKDQIAPFKNAPQEWKAQIDRIHPPTKKDDALVKERFNAFLSRVFGEFYYVGGTRNLSFHSVLDTGDFTEAVLSVGYVKAHYPEVFEKNSAPLRQKLEEIYRALQQVFRDRPDELFNWHDDCYTSEFYSFLKALETFEQMLPPAKEEPSAILSNVQHHRAPTLFRLQTS